MSVTLELPKNEIDLQRKITHPSLPRFPIKCLTLRRAHGRMSLSQWSARWLNDILPYAVKCRYDILPCARRLKIDLFPLQILLHWAIPSKS